MASQVRELRASEAAAAGELLGRALADDPVFVHVVPDPGRRSDLCRGLFAANARHALRFGGCLAATDDDGALAGVACWVDRPEPAVTAREARRLGYAALREAWGAELAQLGTIEAGAMAQLADLPQPWRWLGAIGVDPERGGRGIGSRLLDAVLDRAGRDGLELALVTDRERSLACYERAGMVLTATATEPVSGLEFWAFRKAASGPARRD